MTFCMDPDPRICTSDIRIRIRRRLRIRLRILLFTSCMLATKIFFAYKFLKLRTVHLHNFSQIKVIKKSQYNTKGQRFSYYFCLMIEGAGSRARAMPLTNGSGSGSGRPKNESSGSESATLKKTLCRMVCFTYGNHSLLCIGADAGLDQVSARSQLPHPGLGGGELHQLWQGKSQGFRVEARVNFFCFSGNWCKNSMLFARTVCGF
jgi:hypothetical protein